MSQSETTINQRLDGILAEARAIKYAIKHGALSYSEAKRRILPMLEKLNRVGELIAKKYGKKYIKIRFTDLG